MLSVFGFGDAQTTCRDLMAPLSSAARAPFPAQAQSQQKRMPTQFASD